MAFAIGVSLLVAFTLTPMLSARWLRAEGGRGRDDLARASASTRAIERRYLRSLDWAMAHRWVVVVIMALTFLVDGPARSAVANKNFLPMDDESQFEVLVRAPEGSSLETTADDPGVDREAGARARRASRRRSLTIGGDPQNTQNLGLDLREAGAGEGARSSTSSRSWTEIRRRDPAAVRAARTCAPRSRRSQAFGAGNNAEIQFWIGGPDLDQLAPLRATC